MADDILASLGLDYSGYEQGLGAAAALGSAFVQSQTAAFASLVLPPLNADAYTTGFQAVAGGAADATASFGAMMLAQDAAAASAKQQGAAQTEAAQATLTGTQAASDQAVALGSQVAVQAESSAGLRSHSAASGEAAQELRGLRQETISLATDALPALSGNLTVVNSVLVAVSTSVRAAADEERSFTSTTAIMGAGLTAAGVGAAAGFFAVFDSGLTTLKNTSLQFGLTIPQVEGLQTALQSVGLPATEANMGLRMFTSQLEAMQTQFDKGEVPTSRTATGLARIGVSAFDASGQIRPMSELLPEIFTHFAATAQAAESAGQSFNAAGIASDLFGQRAGSRLVPALLDTTGALQKATDVAKSGGLGSPEEIAKLEALHGSTARATEDFTLMAVKIGSDVSPAVTKFIDLLDSGAKAFSGLSPWLRDSVITFPLVAGGVLLTVSGLSSLVGVGASAVTSLAALGTRLVALVATNEVVAVTNREAAVSFGAMAIAEEEEAVAATTAGVATASIIPGLGIVIGLASALGVGLAVASGAFGQEAKAATEAASGLQHYNDTVIQNGRSLAQRITELKGERDATESIVEGYRAQRDALEQQQNALRNSLGVGVAASETYQQNRAAITQVDNAIKAYGSDIPGLDAEIKRLTESQHLATVATETQQTALQKAAGEAGVSVTATLSYAQAQETLAAAVKKSQSSEAEGLAFTQALANAERDATLVGEARNAQMANLTQLAQGQDPVLKLLAQDELDILKAVTALSPAVSQISVALDQARGGMEALAAASKQLQSEIQSAGTQSQKFALDLGTMSATESANFADRFGSAAAAVAASMHQASVESVTAWQTANGQLLSDHMALDAAITNHASAAEQQQLQLKIDADQQIQASSLNTANARIADEKGYVDAVLKAANESLGYKKQLGENELHLSHQTLEERKTDLGYWLSAEQIVIQEILRLEQLLATESGQISRAITSAFIADAKARLDALQVNVDLSGKQAEYIKKDEEAAKAATAASNAAAAAETRAINLETAGINELTAARKAANDLAKQDDDITKQVGASKLLVTQQQIDGLHQTTEADRAQASADLATTNAALANYQAIAAADAGVSTARVNQAKAVYNQQKELSDQSVADFDTALSKESTAQTAFDAQQAASASAAAKLHTDGLAFAQAEADARIKLAVAVAGSEGTISALTQGAALESLAAWQRADAAVLADQQALTQKLAPEDRKRLDAQLALDEGTRADAQRTATAMISDAQKNGQAQAAAYDAGQQLIRTSSREVASMLLADVHLTNGQTIASYQDMALQIIAIDQQLAGATDPVEIARLEATRKTDLQILADRQQTATDSIKAENDYVTAYRSAEQSLISDAGKLFDLQHQLTHETLYERRAGLDQWLQAEITVTSQIIALEEQLRVTTDAILRQGILDKIADLNILEAKYAELAREAESNAHDAEAAAKATADSMRTVGDSVASAFTPIRPAIEQNITAPLTQAKSAAQALQDQISQLESVFSTPTTAGLQYQQQADQIAIQIAQLQQQGATATNPRVVALERELTGINAHIKALSDEQKAQEDLAKTTGLLDSGMTNSIEQVRASTGALTLLETQSAKSTTVLGTFSTSIDDATRALSVWVKALEQSTASTGGGGSAATGGGGGGGLVSQGANQYVRPGAIDITGGVPAELPGGGGYASYARYDLGTDYVPSDGLAYIHRGERITPAAMNVVGQQGPPAGFGGGGGDTRITVTFGPGAVQVNGSNLDERQLARAIKQGAADAIEEKFAAKLGRGATLAGRRAG